MSSIVIILMNILTATLATYLNMYSPDKSLALHKVFILSADVGSEVAGLLRFHKNISMPISLLCLIMSIACYRGLNAPKRLNQSNMFINSILFVMSLFFWGL